MALHLDHHQSRARIVEDLRRLLPRLESLAGQRGRFSLGIPTLDAHLSGGGLAAGALHEIVPSTEREGPAAFGFAVALFRRLPQEGPAALIVSQGGLAAYGRPYGHGLGALGLDPARTLFIETRNEREALWAMEECLRSAAPVAVAGALGREPDFKMSQRLAVAAGKSGLPLILLRPSKTLRASAATTRWRIGAAEAHRDRFGLIERWRWRVALERCRNGRPGEWLVEFDHVAHRFSLAAAVADPALSRERSEKCFA